MTASVIRPSVVPNFRRAAGLRKLYRSSAPDDLADVLGAHSPQHLSESERFVLYDATLVVDLRSPSEIDEEKSRALIQRAPGGEFEEITTLEELKRSTSNRQLLRLKDSCITRSAFLKFATNHWVDPKELQETPLEKQSELVFHTVNSRGLTGLVEAVLEIKDFVCSVLQGITIHLEQRRGHGKVLIHCSIGKDRTGVIIMLCEAMLGVKDSEIVNDFSRSKCIKTLAERRFNELFQGKLDVNSFSHAKPQTMRLTLDYLRSKYGSVSSYLDSIGFDKSWQTRFVEAAS